MYNDKHGYHYADMEMDGSEDQGRVISPKSIEPDGQAMTPNEKVRRFIESFNIATGVKVFVQQAQKLAEKVEREAEFVPFKRYYPQYDSMNELQRKWYFYWRNEVRYERYLRSDLSYIFLYVYELINGVGWQDPQDGYYMLMEVWTAYRSDFPKLDDYMGDWIADFVLVHQLDIPYAELAERVPHGIFGSKDLYELELMHRFQQETVDCSMEMLVALSDYNVMRSKFYIGGGRKDLETYVPKVLALTDRYMQAKRGQRLIDYLHPGEVEKRERVLFRGALYDSSLHGKRVMIGVVPLSTHPPLRAMVTQLIRLTENTLRRLHGFKGKLRLEAVDEEISVLIERYLEREFGVITQPPRPKVSIDAAKLAQLQAESDQVREWLTVEEVDGASIAGESEREAKDADAAEVLKMAQGCGQKGTGSAGVLEQEAEGTDATERVREVDGADASEVLKMAQGCEQEDECAYATHGNEHGQAIGSSIDECQDELQQQHAVAGGHDSGSLGQQPSTAELDEEWTALAACLQPVHIEVLQLLLRGADASALFQLAVSHGSMPEMLVEEINTAAMDFIGDLVIDEDAIVDEYRTIVEQWLGDDR